MKKLCIAIALTALVNYAGALTKGTNTLGFGISGSSRTDQFGSETVEQKQSALSIAYGHFIKDNSKIGFGLTYSNYEYLSSGQDIKGDGYGGNIFYQKYFPVIKKLYAYAGGNLGYSSGEQKNTNNTEIIKNSSYALGGYGGASWFITKRFALEANLLSANFSYSKGTTFRTSGTPSSSESKSFSLSTQGALSNNLGFNILFLF